jgi:4-hydroxyphenylpyruvate dioxygenase
MNQHGDGVRDVAFEVEDCRKTYDVAVSRGAVSIMEPKVLEDKNGKVTIATIKTLGDTRHSFIQRNEFKGLFLPDYEPLEKDPIVSLLGEVKYNFIDHVVLNHKEIGPNVEFYEKVLDFHKYWSIDDSILHTEYSALNSVVVADYDEVIRMPQNEPSFSGLRKSQIQEYVEYYNGSGVQHIASKKII